MATRRLVFSLSLMVGIWCLPPLEAYGQLDFFDFEVGESFDINEGFTFGSADISAAGICYDWRDPAGVGVDHFGLTNLGNGQNGNSPFFIPLSSNQNPGNNDVRTHQLFAGFGSQDIGLGGSMDSNGKFRPTYWTDAGTPIAADFNVSNEGFLTDAFVRGNSLISIGGSNNVASIGKLGQSLQALPGNLPGVAQDFSSDGEYIGANLGLYKYGGGHDLDYSTVSTAHFATSGLISRDMDYLITEKLSSDSAIHLAFDTGLDNNFDSVYAAWDIINGGDPYWISPAGVELRDHELLLMESGELGLGGIFYDPVLDDTLLVNFATETEVWGQDYFGFRIEGLDIEYDPFNQRNILVARNAESGLISEFFVGNYSPTSVPEPSTVGLLFLVSLSVIVTRRRTDA